VPATRFDVDTQSRRFVRNTRSVPEFQLTRHQIVVGAVVILGAMLLATRLLNHSHAAAAPPIPTAASTQRASSTRMYVDVVGAVLRPGLYRLPPGSRVADALVRAGGATAKAQLDLVNLAAPIADGEQVVVPRRGPAATAATAATAGSAAGGGAASGPVQLSTATAEQLDSLPGIGPVTAQKILDYRQQHGGFSSIDELDAVPGIGPSRLAQLKGLVVP
jgi:competence protein ComEA